MRAYRAASAQGTMMTAFTPLLDAEALYQSLLNQIRPYAQARAAAGQALAVVGIYSGGAWIAARLVADLGLEAAAGLIDVSFYRDDYAAKGLHAAVKPSQIPFDVNGAEILLVDDVLYTGRTTRAAINELFDYGRPARILLAALVDRGGRELPVAADFVAHIANFEPAVSINLQRAEDGTLSFSIDHA